MAERFHALPSVVAREMDEDPEHLNVICADLLAYREAHGVLRRADAEETKRWKASEMFQLAEQFEAEDAAAALGIREDA